MNEAWPDVYKEGYTSVPAWIYARNSVPGTEAPSLNISSHGTSLKWTQRLCQFTEKQSGMLQWKGAFPFEFEGKSIKTETKTWLELPHGEKATIEQTLASEEVNESRRTGLWELVRDPSTGLNGNKLVQV